MHTFNLVELSVMVLVNRGGVMYSEVKMGVYSASYRQRRQRLFTFAVNNFAN